MIKRYLWKATFMIITVLLIMLFSGCNKNVDPIDVFHEYTDAWSKMDFYTMYDMMSDQNKTEISQQEFINTYQEFYEGIKVQSVGIKLLLNEDEISQENKSEGFINFPVNVELAQSMELNPMMQR